MSINELQVTDMKIFPIKNKKEGSKLLAFAKMTLNEALVITGIRIVEGKDGVFASFPQSYNENDKEKPYRDITFPITAEAREYFMNEILEAFEESENQN